MADEGLEPPVVIERSEIMWIYEVVVQGRSLGFSLPCMTKLAAFASDRIRSLPLEESHWGFGVVHDKEPHPTFYEAAFENCVSDCAQQLMARESSTA